MQVLVIIKRQDTGQTVGKLSSNLDQFAHILINETDDAAQILKMRNTLLNGDTYSADISRGLAIAVAKAS